MHGDGGIRTLDPHVANVVLSQLSYAPLSGAAFYRTDQIIIHQIPHCCKAFFSLCPPRFLPFLRPSGIPLPAAAHKMRMCNYRNTIRPGIP